jgi:predicted Rossmann fold nucleotide-binding protein DprA/Smf involved in DNA uptake
MKYYAGIGSRETPKDICLYMTAIAKRLASLGYTCNSGGADGADSAFERGAVINRQIFLPWDGFNKRYIISGRVHKQIQTQSVLPARNQRVFKFDFFALCV